MGFLSDLFGISGQTDLGDIRRDIESFRPQDIDVRSVLGRIPDLDLSGIRAGVSGLQGTIDRLLERSTLDQTAQFRQGLRQDIGAFNRASRAQTRQDFGAAGINPALAAAQSRASQANLFGTIGRSTGQFQIGQQQTQLSALQAAAGAGAQLGQLELGAAGLQLGQNELIGGISSDVARANLGAQTAFGQTGANILTGARQRNTSNQANANAGLLSLASSFIPLPGGGGGQSPFSSFGQPSQLGPGTAAPFLTG